jgi:hypothetical protein
MIDVHIINIFTYKTKSTESRKNPIIFLFFSFLNYGLTIVKLVKFNYFSRFFYQGPTLSNVEEKICILLIYT